MKSKILSFYLFIFFIFSSNLFAYDALEKNHEEDIYDSYIQSLASLIFYFNESKTLENAELNLEEKIIFSDEEIEFLWQKASRDLNLFQEGMDQRKSDFDRAYQQSIEMKYYKSIGLEEEEENANQSVCQLLQKLWNEAIELEEESLYRPIIDSSLMIRSRMDPNIKNNQYLSSKAIKNIKPYLLPGNHPMRHALDELCLNQRVTEDSRAFHEAGFKIIANRPRSNIHVAKHSMLPGYLVKVYLDTTMKIKDDKQSWEWFVLRCQGAEKIKNVIKKKKIKHFVVAKKWIYCLPPKPSPSNDGNHKRHLALLLVSDMDLVSKKKNIKAWYKNITKNHLEELHMIISRAKGSSYRSDNIAYTHKGKFAFIDTEYPYGGPDFTSIRHYLNPTMRKYWDELIKKGGRQ